MVEKNNKSKQFQIQDQEKENFENGLYIFRGRLNTTPVSVTAYALIKMFTRWIMIGLTRIGQRRGR